MRRRIATAINDGSRVIRRPLVIASVGLGGTAILAVLLVMVPQVASVLAWPAVGAPLVAVLALFKDEAKQLTGRALGHATRLGAWAERETVRLDLEGTLSLGAEHLSAACPQVAPAFKLAYLRTPEEVSRLPDGTLVIGIAEHQDRTSNLVAAAWAYVRHGTLTASRPFINPDVAQGIDFVLTQSLLEAGSPEAVAEFLQRIWTPAVAGKETLATLTRKLQHLSDGNLLGSVVLSEFTDLSTRVGLRWPSQDLFDETAGFIDYLYALATREHGEDVGDGLEFNGNYIKCRVIFIARPAVYERQGPSPYRQAIEWTLGRAFHQVYLLASGRNTAYLDDVVQPYRADGRVRSIADFQGHARTERGRRVRHRVVRMTVDVRYQFGIGSRAIVTVGGVPIDQRRARAS